MGSGGTDATTRSLDRLRAQLYRPGATAEDLRHYEEALAAIAPAEPDVEESGPRTERPRRRRLVLAAALVAALLAGVVVARQLSSPTSPAAAPQTTATQADDALHWQPERPVVGVRLAGSPTAQQFHGRGAGVAQLEAQGLPSSEGRLEVMLTVADDAPVLWTATRVDTGPGSIVNVRVLGEHSGSQRRAVPVPVSFLYAGGPPTAVHVQVPSGVAWGLVVAPAR